MTTDERHTCPRRVEGPLRAQVDNADTWSVRGHGDGALGDTVRTCNHCGSMHPDDVMSGVEDSTVVIGPTDKNYKAYITQAATDDQLGKFYYQHFSDDQRRRFVALMIKNRVAWGYPGHPYVLPFFVRVGGA